VTAEPIQVWAVKPKVGTKYVNVSTMNDFKKMILHLWNADRFTFDIESSSLDPFKQLPHPPQVLGMAFSTSARTGYWLTLQHKEAPWTPEQFKTILKFLKRLLEAKRGIRIAHGGWYDVMYVRKVLGIRIANYLFDTLTAHYVGVTEELGVHSLDMLAWEHTDMGGYDQPLNEYKAAHPECNPAQGGTYANIPLEILWPYGVQDADCTMRLADIFQPIIEKSFADLYNNIVMPGTHGLIEVVYRGAPIDREWLAHCKVEYPRLMKIETDRIREFPEVLEIEKELTNAARKKKANDRVLKFRKRSEAIKELYKTDPEKAGAMERRLIGDVERAKLRPAVVKPIQFNPKSPIMVTKLLFEKLGFKHYKKTKKGAPCADKEVLKDLWQAHKHPIIMAVGRYVKLKTMYSMFVDGLEEKLGDDGKLRGRYNPAGTVTGRLSMAEPNLQQIPRKIEYDEILEPFVDPTWPSIKKLFKARPGYVILQFDYSQAELRVLAALSKEPTLLKAFANGEDVHKRVAAECFKVLLEEVTKTQRTRAKTVNFGLLYGQGAKKLAKALGITEDEAKDFIKLYFRTLRKLRAWIQNTKNKVRETGESWSAFGRVRRLPEALTRDEEAIARAERQAVNSPIQGTASDCTLIAVARITKWLRVNKMKSGVIATVHDSIVLEVHVSELTQVYKMVKKIMMNPPNAEWLGEVIMEADADGGPSWGELVGIDSVEGLTSILPKAA